MLTGALALLMFIPLALIENQVNERKGNAERTTFEISRDWGMAQTVSGPCLVFQYDVYDKDPDGKPLVKKVTKRVYPETLKTNAAVETQTLHRSIYDVTVYQSDLSITAHIVIPEDLLARNAACQVEMGISDLRGIVREARFRLGDDWYRFTDGKEAVLYKEIDPKTFADLREDLTFEMQLRVKGSESLFFRPVGGITEITVTGDSPQPSFSGDFLPAEREVRDDGFTAKWIVSQINRGGPEESSFGVRLLQKVSQYQQTTRALKYGLLIILLVFVAGLSIELAGKRPMSIIQYLVIGLSLALFYALVLSFSEFMAFWMAYALAAVMTTAALFGYFRAIFKDNYSYALTGLVAVAYILAYVLLQMETYALLAGTLILFALLAVIMYLTRNLNRKEGNSTD